MEFVEIKKVNYPPLEFFHQIQNIRRNYKIQDQGIRPDGELYRTFDSYKAELWRDLISAADSGEVDIRFNLNMKDREMFIQMMTEEVTRLGGEVAITRDKLHCYQNVDTSQDDTITITGGGDDEEEFIEAETPYEAPPVNRSTSVETSVEEEPPKIHRVIEMEWLDCYFPWIQK